MSSLPVKASTESFSKPRVDNSRRSYRSWLFKYRPPFRTIAGVTTISPTKNPTPSATIAKIAAYLPKLCRISRYVVFHIADFLLFTSPHLLPRRGTSLYFQQTKCLTSIHSILYHSICSTGTICSFLRISVTVPFFTVIIRSAIAVIAWLCVITTTVTPFLRQVSCSSFSTALPVL